MMCGIRSRKLPRCIGICSAWHRVFPSRSTTAVGQPRRSLMLVAVAGNGGGGVRTGVGVGGEAGLGVEGRGVEAECAEVDRFVVGGESVKALVGGGEGRGEG